MSDQEKEELLILILNQYHIIKHIKNRCHNATDQDMIEISKIVSAYNKYVGIRRLKPSACSIPHILDLTRKLLIGNGKLEANERDLLSNL